MQACNQARATPRSLLKIAPDLTDSQLDDILEIARETNLSRRPLRAAEVIRYLHQKSDGGLTIIGAGGIHSAADAQEKLAAGASLIQLYTPALSTKGPRW